MKYVFIDNFLSYIFVKFISRIYEYLAHHFAHLIEWRSVCEWDIGRRILI